MKKIFLLMCVGMFTWSCQQNTEETTEDAIVETEEIITEEVIMEEVTATNVFGEVVDESKAITLVALGEQTAGKDSVEDLTVTGKVAEVCQMKGCWMTLEKPDGSTMRVKFKDYALFMPKDIAGREVVLHGKAKISTTSVDELKHLAQDGGKSEAEIAAITEAETKLAFEADGVLIK